jgi:hypothetical protein
MRAVQSFIPEVRMNISGAPRNGAGGQQLATRSQLVWAGKGLAVWSRREELRVGFYCCLAPPLHSPWGPCAQNHFGGLVKDTEHISGQLV